MRFIMKPVTLLFALIFYSANAFSQPAEKLPGYLQNPAIPDFNIWRVEDSTAFTKKDLDPTKVTIMMVFGPECSHCKDATKKILEQIDLFKDVQIIMYAPTRHELAVNFYKEMGLSGYPQFIVGSDPPFHLGGFYQVSSLPTLFLYDKKGKFVKKYEKADIVPEKIASDL